MTRSEEQPPGVFQRSSHGSGDQPSSHSGHRVHQCLVEFFTVNHKSIIAYFIRDCPHGAPLAEARHPRRPIDNVNDVKGLTDTNPDHGAPGRSRTCRRAVGFSPTCRTRPWIRKSASGRTHDVGLGSPQDPRSRTSSRAGLTGTGLSLTRAGHGVLRRHGASACCGSRPGPLRPGSHTRIGRVRGRGGGVCREQPWSGGCSAGGRRSRRQSSACSVASGNVGASVGYRPATKP